MFALDIEWCLIEFWIMGVILCTLLYLDPCKNQIRPYVSELFDRQLYNLGQKIAKITLIV